MPSVNPSHPTPDTPDTIAEVIRAVRRMVDREYGKCQWATVVVHIDDETPNMVLPVVTPSSPSDA
jgi:hypothetical protein